MNTKNEFEMEIDLQELVRYLRKKVLVIMAVTLLCTILAFAICSLLPPEYTASTRIYVLNRENGIAISYSDYQIANQMVADYKVLITGENVTQRVIRELELPMEKKELEAMIHLEAPKDTRFLEISVTSNDPKQAAAIANMVRVVACEEIERIMDVESVNLVYEAALPQRPSGPAVLEATLITGCVVFCLVTLYYAVTHIMDDAIRTEEDVEARLGLHVLAVIPNSGKTESKNAFATALPRSKKQK